MSLDLIQTRTDLEGSLEPAILLPFLEAFPDENHAGDADQKVKHKGDCNPAQYCMRHWMEAIL